MYPMTPELTRAIETARGLLAREVSERQRRGTGRGAAALWAAVRRDGRILVGTPLFYPGEGFYVDHTGHWTEA
ncbi:MAG: hypothetical protein PVI28_03000 [Gammaproteobacteria bacterium]|jgi:hypothetical protein